MTDTRRIASRDDVAEVIYAAMVWAAQQQPPPNGAAYPSWQNGNSDAETKARCAADTILSALTPVPVAGWRDMDSAPKWTKVILCHEDWNHTAVAFLHGVTLKWTFEDGIAIALPERLRYWMPLPPAPTEHPTEQPSVRDADLLERMTNDHRPLSLYRECDEDGGSWVVVDNSRDTVVSSGSDAQEAMELAFPKRCKGGDLDAFNGDCLWCGAPMGGTCQDPALRSLAQEGE